MFFGTRKPKLSFKKAKKKESLFGSLIWALCITVFIRTLFFDNFHVPSGSMKSTLLIGDKLSIAKYSYGYSKYSIPFALIPFRGRILKFGTPERGDIVVFKIPSDGKTNYVKRLIGIPGDRVQVKNGELYLNGKGVERIEVEKFVDVDGSEIQRFIEILPNGKAYYTLDTMQDSVGDNTEEFFVPKGKYMFLGDNRDNSLDSRFDLGFVDENLLLGKVKVVFFSSAAALLNPFKWGHIRWGRVWTYPDKEAGNKYKHYVKDLDEKKQRFKDNMQNVDQKNAVHYKTDCAGKRVMQSRTLQDLISSKT